MNKPTGPGAATDVAIDPAQELAGAPTGCVLYVAEGGSHDRGRHLLLSSALQSARIARKYFKELMRKHGLYDERDPSDDTQ
ncbi:hypothetical protein ACFL6C_11310 [Myxococcota bacterium]